MPTEEDELLAAAQLGVELEKLRGNPAFQYLLGALQQDADEAKNKLALHEATDFRGIQALQNKVQRHLELIALLEEAIANGHIAYAQLTRVDEG